MNVKLLSINDIGLSQRASNVLMRHKVFTVGELMQYREEDLLGFRNAGAKTVKELLQKIEEYKTIDLTGEFPPVQEQTEIQMPENFEFWITEDKGRIFIKEVLGNRKIDELEVLSAKSFNLLSMNGYETLSKVVFLTVDELMKIPRMEERNADEILLNCRRFLLDHKPELLAAYAEHLMKNKEAVTKNINSTENKKETLTIQEMILAKKNQKEIRTYVEANEVFVEQMGLSKRAKNALVKNGFSKMSELFFLQRGELQEIKNFGVASITEVLDKINAYIAQHEQRINAFLEGDFDRLYDETGIMDMILRLYQTEGFKGLSFQDIKEKLDLPDSVSDQKIKNAVGKLLAVNELVYVDYRCYRVYPKVMSYVELKIQDPRIKRVLQGRLRGKVLEELGTEENVTRERIRQIEKDGRKILKDTLFAETGMNYFDEDYYQYLFTNYEFGKEEASEWLGISLETWNYLTMVCGKRGTKSLTKAAEDAKLSASMRLKIRNYLNRNKIYIDKMWIEKRRGNLEDIVLRKYCQDEKKVDEFFELYNDFLRQHGIEEDQGLYYTPELRGTRKNRLTESKNTLYRYGEIVRYYDIQARDYTELLDTLNLDAYENTEVSTYKLMQQYPEIMKKYDIRHPYELHNLLKKIIQPGSYHKISFQRMPMIGFGTYSREQLLRDLLFEHAPLTQNEFLDLINSEYGYDRGFVHSTYLPYFSNYLYNGVYSVDQKVMSKGNRDLLRSALKDDFYYLDEIRSIYKELIPDSDVETVNAYNLKQMGGLVLANYVLFNYPTMDAYCTELLTKAEVFDISPYRRRYGYLSPFTNVLSVLRSNLDIIEFEPNQFVHIRRLEKKGITKEMLRSFCDGIYDFVQDEEFFSIQSLKKAGLKNELDDIGFDDWFFATLLASDDRFSWTYMYNNIILKKHSERISIKDLLLEIISRNRVIDTLDLIRELQEVYGCNVQNRSDILGKLSETTVYCDKILDRLYITEDEFYRELEEMEGI